VVRDSGKTGRRLGTKLLALVFLGAGLILVGVAAFIFLTFASANLTSSNLPLSAPVQVDFPAPSFIMTDLQGNSVSLESKRGQVVLINNWATWCPPCREEMPTLEAFYQKYQEQGFVVIAIDAGEEANVVRDFIERMGLTFPVWLDPDQEALRTFRNPALPSSYLVDREGIVRLAWSGLVTMQALEEHVTPFLEE
jgi:thiol-disulfide isomerase/thioredoxin